VLDTNVLVSGTFWKGASFRILERVFLGDIVLVLSQEILDEYSAVLEYADIRRKVASYAERLLATQKLLLHAELITPYVRFSVVKDDPDDDKFLEVAVGNAEYIISQDKHLLRLGEFKGVVILTPDEFLTVY